MPCVDMYAAIPSSCQGSFVHVHWTPPSVQQLKPGDAYELATWPVCDSVVTSFLVSFLLLCSYSLEQTVREHWISRYFWNFQI